MLFGAYAQAYAADKPTLYAVVVGVKSFRNPEINPLELSDKDARDFAEFLILMRFHAYDICRLRISFATDDARPSHHCAQETHSPTTLDR
jgi:hypothetical protein